MIDTHYEIRDRLNNLRDRLRRKLKDPNNWIIIITDDEAKDLINFMDHFLDD